MPDRYARFYAPLALLLTALSFAPLFETVHGEVFTRQFGIIFDWA
ncbi:hypothetical protein [Dactylosporangium sp. NPDC051541]